MQLLKRKRKKLNFVEKLAGLYKDGGWREIEDRVLALVQLWADTFMMHEDKYPAFMKAYRELRQEGIKFPTRNPNERFMINFDGEPSPAFELADMEQQEPAQAFRYSDLFGPSEFDVLAISMPELREIIANAQSPGELQTPGVKELVRKCRVVQKKLVEFVASKSVEQTDADTNDLLEVLDYVNSQMDAFKTAAKLIRRGITGPQVREELKIDHTVDEPTPLQKLEAVLFGRRSQAQEEEPQVLEEPARKTKLQEPVDLLLDFEEPQPVVQQPSQEVAPTAQVEDDLFGLNSLVLDAPVQPGAPAQVMPQPMNPQVPFQQVPYQGHPQMPVGQFPYGQPPMGYNPAYGGAPAYGYQPGVPQGHLPYQMPATNPFAQLNKVDVFSHLVNNPNP